MRELVDSIADCFAVGARHELLVARVRGLLSVLLKTPPAVPAAWHPLGFIHFSLGEVRRGDKLRLHVWPRMHRRTQEPPLPIHDHIFDLESEVLAGSLLNRFFSVEGDTATPTHRVFEVLYDGDVSALRATEQTAQCQQISERLFVSGDRYRVARGAYHATEVADSEFAATVVLTTAISDRAPLVLGPLSGPGTYRYRRQLCSPSEVEEALKSVDAALAGR